MPSAIDLSTFAELRESVGDEFAAELVSTFMDEAPGILADMRAAMAAGDSAGYRRAAHSLKSNGNTFGAFRFAELARQAEHDGFAGDGGADTGLLDDLDTEYAAAVAELRELTSG